jgi:hypothetical protein
MVRRLYGDSLSMSNAKKEIENDRSQRSEDGRELWLCSPRHVPLQPVHLQELQLLSAEAMCPLPLRGAHVAMEIW